MKGIVNLLKKESERVMFVGEYVPHNMEYISEDGNRIVCKICGQTKYEKKWSPIFHKQRWNGVHEDDSCGCSCMREAWEQNKMRRAQFFKQYSKSLDYTFNCTAYTARIPESMRNARPIDRWYFTGPTGTRTKGDSDIFRQSLAMLDISQIAGTNTFLHGPHDSLKTSMLCCARNAYLDKGYSAILSDFRQIAQMKLADSQYLHWLYKVDVLLLDDLCTASVNGRLGDFLSELLEERTQKGLNTIYASAFPMEEMYHFYPERLIKAIKGDENKLIVMEFSQMEMENV